MNNKQFYQRLQEKIPVWQAHGWLQQSAAENILQEALHDSKLSADTENKSHRLSFMLSIMGVLLLSVAAISFFAANWQGMSKLLKLSLLFSSMTAAYLAAAWALSKQHQALGQALLLLGVLLFGNNIMLIAQIYHIDSHYPNGILLWSAGALLTTLILRSETVLIAAMVLSVIWTGMETFNFRLIHWQWLLFWAISAGIVWRHSYHLAAHFCVLSFFLWLLFSFENFTHYSSDSHVIQIYLLLGMALFLLAEIIKPIWSDSTFLVSLSRYSFSFSVLFLYVLSFPKFNSYSSFYSAYRSEQSYVWLITLLLMFMLLSLFQRLMQRQRTISVFYKWSGFLWLLILFSLFLFSGFFFHSAVNYGVIIINILLLALVVGLIYQGVIQQQLFYVNAAFVIFTITLLSRYFDTFWGLMNRSIFFFIGGIVLILGGYWLEKKRRQLSQKIEHDGINYG